jgi:hypothetical protein
VAEEQQLYSFEEDLCYLVKVFGSQYRSPGGPASSRNDLEFSLADGKLFGWRMFYRPRRSSDCLFRAEGEEV